MSLPPSSILDTVSVADGIQGFSSGAADTDIFSDLALVALTLFIGYNIAMIFDFDLAALVNFCIAAYTAILNLCTSVYDTFVNWTTYIYQHLTVQSIRTLPQRLRNSITLAYTSTIIFIESPRRFLADAKKLLPWLLRSLCTSTPHPQTITVDTLTLPLRGTITVIHGLPSDVSAPEARRYLELALWSQYRDQVRDDNTPVNDNTPINDNIPANDPSTSDSAGEAEIDTSRPGLWMGTCVRDAATEASPPSTPVVTTPASETSTGSVASEVEDAAVDTTAEVC